MKRLTICLSLTVLALGCSNEAVDTMTKDEARATVAKGDFPFDICAELDWYGDGICDDFCQYPDVEDCGPEPAGCFSDSDCGTGQSCNADEVCLSPCPAGEICIQVCMGFCVEEPEPAPTICGGFSNTPCSDDEWCDFTPAPEGAASSMTGICKPRPEICYEIYAPVCGLDGETYANDCFAHSAGTDVDYEGECEEPVKICGGFAGFLCDDDEFCAFSEPPPEAAADFSGICLPRPTACTREFAPVCGLDNQNYSNECNANAAGVSVKHDGPCL